MRKLSFINCAITTWSPVVTGRMVSTCRFLLSDEHRQQNVCSPTAPGVESSAGCATWSDPTKSKKRLRCEPLPHAAGGEFASQALSRVEPAALREGWFCNRSTRRDSTTWPPARQHRNRQG